MKIMNEVTVNPVKTFNVVELKFELSISRILTNGKNANCP